MKRSVIVIGIRSTLECNFFKMLEIYSFRLKISININFEELFLNCENYTSLKRSLN